MSAKEYLKDLKRLDTMINQKIKELDDLKALREGVGGLDYSKDRVQTSMSGDAAFVKPTLRIIELEREIAKEVNEFANKKHAMINQIHSLSNSKHIEILYKRYIEFKSFEIIAVEMKYNYDYVRALHSTALKKFIKICKVLTKSHKIS